MDRSISRARRSASNVRNRLNLDSALLCYGEENTTRRREMWRRSNDSKAKHGMFIRKNRAALVVFVQVCLVSFINHSQQKRRKETITKSYFQSPTSAFQQRAGQLGSTPCACGRLNDLKTFFDLCWCVDAVLKLDWLQTVLIALGLDHLMIDSGFAWRLLRFVANIWVIG